MLKFTIASRRFATTKWTRLTQISIYTTTHSTPVNFINRGRLMSSSSPSQKKEFLIQIPDFPNTGRARKEAQAAHAQQVQPLVDSGDLVLGSVLLKDHPKENEKPQITGSVVIMHAEDEEAVWKFLEEDAYTQQGVWDVKSAKVWPIITGIRTAL